ncbi:MAG: ERF family protein [Epibacterium sp.]|nr:ERF family protein [Epibacterium sp.]NQX73955.1 ERF family protein [Epibacterium sp.]
MSETQTFPPKLAAALCKVSGEVKQLGKSERNSFAKYDFVSVDKFYAAIGPIMAAHGVHCIPDCIESEVFSGKNGKPTLRERWAFILIHEAGECAGPFHRTVTVPAEGAQAHGSSESYAQKQFLRGVFRVPTGDKDDADYQKAEPHEIRQPAPKAPSVHPENPLDWDDLLEDPGNNITPLNGAQSREPYKLLCDVMRTAQTPAELVHWAKENDKAIWELSSTARHHLREEFDRLNESLMEQK